MPVRKKTSTTRLPQALQQEIAESTGNSHPRKQWTHKLSRKEARKQDRAAHKQKKAEFFSNNNKRSAENEHPESPKRKKARNGPGPAPHLQSRPATEPDPPTAALPKPAPPSRHVTKPPAKKTQTPLEKLAGGSNAPRPSSLRTQKEKDEDNYIAYLESRLGSKNSGKKMMEEDGLDDLFDLVSSLTTSGQQQEEGPGSDPESVIDDGSGSDEETDEEESYEEWNGIEESEKENESENENGQETSPPVLDEKSTKTATRYVPPHLRSAQGEDNKNSDVIIKLTKQLNGLLNRMSEQNMATILDSMEEIYRNNRRNDVTSTLTTLIINGICSHSSLLDSFVVLHAAFVSSLHKIIGIEFAAYFVQNVVALYEKHYEGLQDQGSSSDHHQAESVVEGKECSNLIVLLSELYNFQVVSSVLVFDIIRGLLEHDLTEFSVELLLKIVRNSGQQLRQDDPSALKDIIQIVQNKVSDKDDVLSSRTRFMIETLTNLKNNKLKKNANQNQGGEAVDRMKKFLSGLNKNRHVLAHEPLRVSLQDLHAAETKGKWWLVGAAWGGDPLVDRQDALATNKSKDTADPPNDINSNALLTLARKQGMNTDIRRSIFVVLMSSDDYVDACERLSQLNLTELQQREIVRVLLHCCGNEKSYNPYYTLVCQHLCRTSHAYRITLQFCLWDFLRDLGETTVGGAETIKNLKDDGAESFDIKNVSKTRMRNVAKAYAWWIAKDCVTLAVLKPVDFTVLKQQASGFLKEMMTQIFISSQVATPMISVNPREVPASRNRSTVEEIFIKATRIQTLAMGLVYFLTEAFRDLSGEEEGLSKLIKWASGLAKETLRTGVDVVPTL